MTNAPSKSLTEVIGKNGDTWSVYLSKWALGILAALLVVVIVGTATNSFNISADVAVIKNEQINQSSRIGELHRDINKIEQEINMLQAGVSSLHMDIRQLREKR